MSVSKIRQCHITCRVESIDAVHGITAYPRFISPKGKRYNVHNVTAAYNVHTKEARIYAEFDRVSKKVIEDNMEKMGAGSIIIDSFSSEGWENAAETAFRSVVECGVRAGFTLIRHGNEPRAANNTASGGSAIHKAGIYVLRMDNRPKPFFYVGKAEDIGRRIQQHSDGAGAYCITGEPFTRVEPVTKGSIDDMESWERNEVLTRMHEFGIDNVRGWMYTFKNMPIEQKVSAFDQICEKFDFCRKCGRNSHFIRDCQALTTDVWTCGMELRPAYAGANQGSAQETERRMAEVKQIMADALQAAARVLDGDDH